MKSKRHKRTFKVIEVARPYVCFVCGEDIESFDPHKYFTVSGLKGERGKYKRAHSMCDINAPEVILVDRL